MNPLFLLLIVLAVTLLGAAFMSSRLGNDRRDVYLLAGSGIGFALLAMAGMLQVFRL